MSRAILTLFALATVLLSSVRFAGAASPTKPNIIICMTDDQGWGDVACYGHKIVKTPHLDKMASHGIRFERFYANASMCSPTRAGTLTGRNNLRMGIGGPIASGRGHLPAGEITLAEATQGAGYTSGHFGKWHLGDIVNEKDPSHIMHPGLAGFDEWFTTRNVLPTYNPYDGKFARDNHYYHNGRYVPESQGITGDDSAIVMDRTLQWIRKCTQQPDKPFFAFVCFHAVHNPLGMIPKYQQLYAAEGKKGVYYSNLTAIDAAMGRLRNELRALKIADNTMLWFCSDNGPNLKGDLDDSQGPGSKGPFRGSKGNLYEGGVRVPGILEWPAVVRQSRVEQAMVVTTDLFPTILEMIGMPMPARPYDGVSVMKLIRGEPFERTEPVGFAAKGWRALQDGRYKLLRRKGRDAGYELYDMVADPYEKSDLASGQTQRVKQMRAALEAWVKSCERSQTGEDYGAK